MKTVSWTHDEIIEEATEVGDYGGVLASEMLTELAEIATEQPTIEAQLFELQCWHEEAAMASSEGAHLLARKTVQLMGRRINRKIAARGIATGDTAKQVDTLIKGSFYLGCMRLDTSDPTTLDEVRNRFMKMDFTTAWCPNCQKQQRHHVDPESLHLHLCDVCQSVVVEGPKS